MHKLFLKYQSDPELLKMIKAWNREKQKLARQKMSLNTKQDIDDLLDTNQKQIEIHYKMWDYIYDQEDLLVPQRNYTWGVVIGLIIASVGVANLLLLLKII